MIGVMVVTQGRLADELLGAAETIAGRLENFRAVSLDWSDGLEVALRRIESGVRELDAGDGVLILTDMFGSTPSNAALAVARSGAVEVITGVNLPMVLRLGCAASLPPSLGEAARWLEQKGKRSICRGIAPQVGVGEPRSHHD